MEIIHYSINLEKLLETQKTETNNNLLQAEKLAIEGVENKKKLLKFVLPLMHGIYALHNNKCSHSLNSTTGCVGLLGYSKIDIDKELDFIVNNDFYWKENNQKFEFNEKGLKFKIWLNSRKGCFVYTPNLPYSMTSMDKFLVYGNSVEEELIGLAKKCSKFTQEWK